MIIQHNIAGINSSRNKGITEGKMKKSLEKLSSGYRINRAGDDAAGLAISELMRSQIRGLDQAMRNTNDGIGLTQTGDGALAEVHAMLERMKTLAIQSANGTYDSVARGNLDAERQQLLEEMDRIGQTTNFDEITLFDAGDPPAGFVPPELSGEDPDITLQIGHSKEETMDVPRYYMSTKGLALESVDISTLTKANDSVAMIDNAIEAVADIRAGFGASQNHLEHTYQNLSVTSENMTSAESRIRDTDMADEITSFTRDNIMYQAGNSMCAQANSLPEMVMNLLR
ncbi:MAG: flagellin [Lachnospiraceae bacterium]|jgi:flagellin|nr:flagellin [Lachnospiraceae bacterium]MCI8995972.1 flagellin [Lachnospiraceae bacterium]MCI9135698.1 flagellin [Lachnospiraceae bacterium]